MVRGAALRGLQGVTPRIRKVRRHLGIRLSLKFEGVDPEEDSYTDPWNDTKMCTSRMSWLIFKVSFTASSDSRNSCQASLNSMLANELISG